MLIPCIDLQQGQAVQLVHGRERELAIADAMSLLVKFKQYEWLHVIDLDAAMGNGSNSELARRLCQEATNRFGMKVRVGGGIRSVRRAGEIIKWGAHQIIIGSAAFKNGEIDLPFLRRLLTRVGRPKIVIALDTANGHVVVRGWQDTLRIQPEQVMKQLEPFCAAFLCTDVDREGTMTGANLRWFELLRSVTTHPIIAAGGIRAQREIDALERIGIDAAVGMALYKNDLQ